MVSSTDVGLELAGRSATTLDTARQTATALLASTRLEPVWCGSTDEVIRLMWMPDYRPAFVIDLSRRGSVWELSVVQFNDPRDGGDPTETSRIKRAEAHRPVASGAVAPVLDLLDKAEFWNAPVVATEPLQSMRMVEWRRAGTYHVIVRSSSYDFAIQRAIAALMQLADLAQPAEMAL